MADTYRTLEQITKELSASFESITKKEAAHKGAMETLAKASSELDEVRQTATTLRRELDTLLNSKVPVQSHVR